jgi:transposase
MDEIDILPQFNGVMCHDHWKPYYRYECLHSLCNAHHLRELTRAYEQDNQAWAEEIRVFLVKLNQEVDKAGGLLSVERQNTLRRNRSFWSVFLSWRTNGKCCCG